MASCGNWLDCDASDAVFELNRVDAIASKPAPTIKRLIRSARTAVLATAMPTSTAVTTTPAARRHKHPATGQGRHYDCYDNCFDNRLQLHDRTLNFMVKKRRPYSSVWWG